jgi:spore photoproduct lyase
MITKVERKSMLIRESGRSTDFISPSFGHGCLYNCTYCYMKRHKPEDLSIANNPEKILQAMVKHSAGLPQKFPNHSNQTDEEFWTYDISCNEDFILHLKYHDWKFIFDFFTLSNKLKGSLATKYVNKDLLQYNSFNKIRIRMSLMPEEYRKVLEPNTSTTLDRINFINSLVEAGYEVHINYSPVIVYAGAFELYRELFELVNSIVREEFKGNIKCEVIFLTHNKDKHQYNLDNNLPGEHLIWNPDIQRTKKSQFGGINLRYEPKLKNQLVKEFKELHNSIVPWNTIRYIF